jgi:FMN-dependent NADH-azoreductase
MIMEDKIVAKVLYIKANPKSDEQSRTFRLSGSFITAYRQNNPGDEIITHDLYQEDVKPLSAGDLQTVFGPKDADSANHPVLKYAYEFKASDKIIIAAPMWNLSFPSILKSYLDYITVTGITFHYTEQGPVGLCQGKKAVHIVTRGGAYSEGAGAAYEMGDRYLRTTFGFLGITDFTTIAAEQLDIIGFDVQGELSKKMQEAEEKARTF